MKLNSEIIEEIRSSANIVDVIGHYIPLVKKGKSYAAVCPFHDDHDPSLSISSDKQIYKCFVCGNGGNVFTFVQNFTKCSFPEAVVEVSKIIGKPIEITLEPKKISKNQRYYDVLASMTNYCNYLLLASKTGEKAFEYLTNRGIEKEIIEYFMIGVNPANNSIYDYLHAHNFTDEDILKAGACRFVDNRGISDIFYDRIVFPIHDHEGNNIGFTARDYLNKSDSKYINSNDNIVYSKSATLYNYNRAKNIIKKNSNVFICEGVMDVIAFYKAGKENVVASLGTAFTREQMNLLKTITNSVILAYDGDDAGKKANLKVGEFLLGSGFNVAVIDNDLGLDPDEIIKQYGKNALKDLADKQIGYIDYAIKYYKNFYNLNNYSDRKNMAITLSELINKIKDVDEKENYFNELYELTKIKAIASKNDDKKVYNNKIAQVEFSIDGLTKAEYVILVEIAMSLKALDIYQKEIGCLLDQNNQELAMLIIDDYRKNKNCSLSRIFDETTNNAIKDLIINFATIEGLPTEFDEEYLMSAIGKVKLEINLRRLDELKKNALKYYDVDASQAQKYLNDYEKLAKELGGNNGKTN